MLLLHDQVDVDEATSAPSQDCGREGLDEALAALLDPAAGFPTVAQVQSAADLFVRHVPGRGSSRLPDAVGRADVRAEGRDFLVQVAAGCVGLRMVDHERRGRTAAQTRLTREVARWDEDSQRYVIVLRDPTRVVTSWSRKSRSNMTRALSELDYAPMFDSSRPPAMLTLTYPGRWEAVAPSGKAVKAHLRGLIERWKRAWGAYPPLLWKLEFQARGAPHFHLFAVPEVGTVTCSCTPCSALPDDDDRAVEFRTWLSHAWADVVAADDRTCLRCADRACTLCGDESGCLCPCECAAGPDTERRRHRLAGTGVDFREGVRARDPKRLAVYFTKHSGAGGGKEYQHVVPLAWRSPSRGPGRFWGYRGLKRVRAETYVDVDAFIRARRTLRRLSRSHRLVRSTRVQRVNRTTGVITWRTVNRPLSHLDHGGMGGGFLLVNDGPALAADLARLVKS